MHKLNNENNLDRAVGAADNASQEGVPMRNSSNKTPWHLRFAPGAILRIVSKAVSLASAILQPIRQRLNQWNWRQKTALVTTLAITAGGTLVYQYKANAAWPLILTVAGGTDFLIKVFTAYGINAALSAKVKETAVADSDTWLYRNRELRVRRYDYASDGSRALLSSIVADAMAAQNKTYDTSGTNTRWSPSDLDPDEVLGFVGHNTQLRRGIDESFAILENGGYLFTWTRYTPNSKRVEEYRHSYGGYIKKPTAAEIQQYLDDFRASWNAAFQDGSAPGRRPARLLGPLTLGHLVQRDYNSYTCDKEVKLWSDFEHIAVPGAAGLSPTELEEKDGHRSTYVTKFSYKAREAGYNGSIVTKVPQNERPRHDYPEPMSWCDDNFLGQSLSQIPWENYKIIGTPAWVGRAKRFFKHKKIYQWCLTHNTKHPPGRRGHRSTCRRTIKHEYPVYQNENVKKPSN